MSKVVVIGSANVDFTVRTDRIPRLGETVSGGEFYTAFGGKGANQAMAALKAGAEVQFLAKLGKDQNGDALIDHLRETGIATDGILRDDHERTGVALIMVDGQGRNAIAVAPGSNWKLSEDDIVCAQSLMSSAEVLLIQLEVPLVTVKKALQLAKHHGLVTILNPAPARHLGEEFIHLVDILTPNQMEACMISGVRGETPRDAVAASRRMINAGVKHVVLTLGEEGACWVHGQSSQGFPGIQVEAVDTTGAGDAFNGALACAVADGKDMNEAVCFANTAGALSTTKKGAQSSIPSREEMERVLASQSMSGGRSPFE